MLGRHRVSDPACAVVAVPSPLRRTFDYTIPSHLSAEVARGKRVAVPFGRQQQIGVVVGLRASTEVPGSRLRPIGEVLDAEPLLDEATLSLLEWAARYYHHPLGEVIQTALPALFRRARTARVARKSERWQVVVDADADVMATLERAPKQAAVIAALMASPGQTRAKLEAAMPGAGAVIKPLHGKGLIKPYSEDGLTPVSGPVLTDAQAGAVDAVTSWPGFGVFLLDGVTGSGKTEVYLRLAGEAIARDRQVLVLVPEIGLTPQMVTRFRARLGVEPTVMHSGLAPGARRDAWAAARSGEVQLVLGTRSSVFTPLPNLGLIVVDEEHDLSYKQQDGFRYSARDLAVLRGQRSGVPVVLGSATPSMESLVNAQAGRFVHLQLMERAGDASMPQVHTVDLRAHRGGLALSTTLLTEMRGALGRGEQTLLFVNRRGFAPALLCLECGYVHECRRCDSKMVVHRQRARIQCHHCGAAGVIPKRCAKCNSEALRPVGVGTQRLEEELNELFPDAAVERIDRDSTRTATALAERLARASSGAAHILVGTQMLAKGHHFPGVTVVGILDADSGLFSTDFRAPERLAQLIVQVAGRAGRAERAGAVYVQTHQPEHPLLRMLIAGSYAHFAVEVLREREEAQFPPFSALALVRAEANQRKACVEFLAAVAERARSLSEQVMVLGPVPAPMERRQGRFREQLLLQASERSYLHQLLDQLAPELETMREARRARWSLDVDPQDLT